MSNYWAERQRDTNKLARKIAGKLFEQQNVTPQQLYGLSMLAWITNSFDGDNATYISSTKIPALGYALHSDFQGLSLSEVARSVASEIGDSSLEAQVLRHTGFTNFYKAFRNSVRTWIEEHMEVLLPLYKDAYEAKGERDRLDVIRRISNLPGIPKANHPTQLMRPEYFLTPSFFMLDLDIKFPLINGNPGVRTLLRRLSVVDSGLVSQYQAMTALYGTGGIIDAADLDQLGSNLSDFISTPEQAAKKKLLEEKDEGSSTELPLKDENDVESVRKAGTVVQRRIHNRLTNSLRRSLATLTLLEGRDDSCMFDALVCQYDGEGNDLLIEVKSSVETPNIRMAVGQLFHYWHVLYEDAVPHLAVLLPERPSLKIESFLSWMGVGVLWFEGKTLCTANEWLQCVAHKES
ncbi:hypothetical protein [Pseudomonas putida]|uniref:hypothetical protein n=1 Tax=Pseudomonas putida TaxID=303 RepID=UPI0031329C12